MHYLVESDGTVTVNVQMDLTHTGMKRITKAGTILTLADGMEQVSWYGNGDGESYNDRVFWRRAGEVIPEKAFTGQLSIICIIRLRCRRIAVILPAYTGSV